MFLFVCLLFVCCLPVLLLLLLWLLLLFVDRCYCYCCCRPHQQPHHHECHQSHLRRRLQAPCLRTGGCPQTRSAVSANNSIATHICHALGTKTFTKTTEAREVVCCWLLLLLLLLLFVCWLLLLSLLLLFVGCFLLFLRGGQGGSGVVANAPTRHQWAG